MVGVDRETFDLVLGFFGGDVKKAVTWWYTSNPLLGHTTPHQMVGMGKSDKLLRWVKERLEENKSG